MAGGSVTNTIRGLSSGFEIPGGIIGTYGDDEQGHLFVDNMRLSGVDISRLRKKKGHTAQVSFILSSLFIILHTAIDFYETENVSQCVCLVDALGNRTMRPCLSNAVKVQVHDYLTTLNFNYL